MAVPASDLRLKHAGSGLPADYPLVPYRAAEGRPFPSDIDYGYESPPELSFGPDGQPSRMRVKFRMNVQDVPRFVQHFQGFSQIDGVGNFNRRLPFNDPDGFGMVGIGSPVVNYVNESGYNPQTGQINPLFDIITDRNPATAPGFAQRKYRYAIVGCEFAHLPYHLATDADVGAGGDYGERARYMTTIQTASNEYVSLDSGLIFWSDAAIGGANNTQVANGSGLIRAVQEVGLTWHRTPVDALLPLFKRWKPLLGTVNDKDFKVPFFNFVAVFPKETMMFRPWNVRERMGPLGFPEYDVELRWLLRDNSSVTETKGWNHFLYPPTGGYFRVTWGKSTGVPIYALKDHDTAFKAV